MKGFNRMRKILWAVDAFQKRDANLKNVAKHVQALADLFGAKVEVASACTFTQMFMDANSFAVLEKPYLEQAEGNLRRIAALFDPLPKIAVLADSPGKKIRCDADRIAAYAEKSGCDMIAVATHARNAMAKFFVGSFAEDLLSRSPLPLVLIGPHHKVAAPHKNKIALFPTDFSKASEKSFKAFLPWARANALSIRIVGDLSETPSFYIPAITADAAFLGGYYPMDTKLFENLAKRRQTLLKKWLAVCKASKVRAAGELYKDGADVADVICKAAKSDKADVIAIPHHPHGFLNNEAFGDGVIRKVVRNANAPVIALHA